ncbi:hypothetical protein [Escherichia albertii]|uniref:hypothetical protein n=1 Tax=Escherichia albertii TaxID=208962 RepID=UPI00211A5F1A|nr:hypothetical protein [Escherichia albertii]UUL21355.1 hypothetical protein NIZ13_23700 [Escherichia albertii]
MNDYLSLMEQARQAEDLRDWKTAAQLYTQAMAVSPKARTMRQRRAKAEPTAAYRLLRA